MKVLKLVSLGKSENGEGQIQVYEDRFKKLWYLKEGEYSGLHNLKECETSKSAEELGYEGFIIS